MTLHRLDDRAWGFDSNCFVCAPGNEHGLRIPFFYDDEAGLVRAEYALGPAFSGPPKYVHGGVTLAILDDAMAWATIASTQAFAFTRTTTTAFLRPVLVGRPHRVEARVLGRAEEGSLKVAAVVLDGEDKRCVEARAEFSTVSAEQARSAIGEVTAADAVYLGH
ncbi:MAG: hypothetical protein M3N68_06925 [Actinomycetota bacterium]|nr:hypothetical protein [Actinomycetota bacterium]